LVTAGSYIMFPQSYIYFGILHFIAIASLLALPLAGLGPWNLAIGVGALAAGNLLSHPLFDQAPLHWIGLMTYKPATEDYVPLLPWFGVVAFGLYAGQYLAQRNLRWIDAATPSALAWLGRHSLFIYMVHQPILIGLIWLARQTV
jgi:uncharacterized membrane protein